MGWRDSLPLVGALLLAVCFALRRGSSDIHKRGAQVLDGRRARRAAARRHRAGPTPLALAGVPVAACEETRHFKLIGTTGTGKSTAIAGCWQGPSAAGIAQSSPIRTAATARAFMTVDAAM